MEKGPLDKTVRHFGLPATLGNQMSTLQITQKCLSAFHCVGEPRLLALHGISAAWRMGGQFDADKDFLVAQDSLRDDLSFFHHLEMVMRKQNFFKKWCKAHFHWNWSCILPLLPSKTEPGSVYFPSPWLLQYLLGVSYLKLERSWRKRNAKVATGCLCPIYSFGIWVTLFCLVRICDSGYLYPVLFPVHSHQHCRISQSVQWSGSTHVHAGKRLPTSPGFFLTMTGRIKT